MEGRRRLLAMGAAAGSAISQSVCLSVCLSVCQSVCVSVLILCCLCWSICLSVRLLHTEGRLNHAPPGRLCCKWSTMVQITWRRNSCGLLFCTHGASDGTVISYVSCEFSVDGLNLVEMLRGLVRTGREIHTLQTGNISMSNQKKEEFDSSRSDVYLE